MRLYKKGKKMSYTQKFMSEVVEIVGKIDQTKIDNMVKILVETRNNNGRLFILGVGGSAGNASHAVNDFRKIAGIESYSPTDNASELTARINDDGWDSSFANWLNGSRIKKNDTVFVLSVGGGNAEKNVSMNLVQSIKLAKEKGAKVIGIVGRDGGYTAKAGDAVLIIPTVNPETVTPHSEAFQAVIWHLIVSHPNIKVSEMKWESTK